MRVVRLDGLVLILHWGNAQSVSIGMLFLGVQYPVWKRRNRRRRVRRAMGMVVVVESNLRRETEETEKNPISALDSSSESPFHRQKLAVVRVPVWIHWQVSVAKGGPM